MQAAKDSDSKAGLIEFDSLIFRHAGYCFSNFVRTLSLSLTFGLVARAPVSDESARHYRQVTRMSSSLALVSDISMMLLGGALKRKERLSSRLGDVLSNLYLATAVLKYYRDNGSNAADLPYVDWNIQLAMYNCQIAFSEFFENLPNKPVAWLLRLIVFPFGRRYRLPNDSLEQSMMKTMLEDCPLRDRITQPMYIGKDAEDPSFIIEDAFNKLLASKTCRDAIRKAVKDGTLEETNDIEALTKAAIKKSICSKSDGEAYLAAEAARKLAIQVDDFPAEKP